MRQKLHDMTVTNTAPLMAPGEAVEATGRARVGKANIARNMAVAVGAAILSGGTMTVHTQQKAFYIVLTNQRLLILEAHWLTSRPTAKIVAEARRETLAVVEAKRGVTATVTLAVGTEGLRLSYPAMDKEGADNLLRALQYQAA